MCTLTPANDAPSRDSKSWRVSGGSGLPGRARARATRRRRTSTLGLGVHPRRMASPRHAGVARCVLSRRCSRVDERRTNPLRATGRTSGLQVGDLRPTGCCLSWNAAAGPTPSPRCVHQPPGRSAPEEPLLSRVGRLVRAVVDHPVEGLEVVLADDPAQLVAVGLADTPVGRDPVAAALALPGGEVLAVATELEVDRGVPLEVQGLGPERDAAAVPDPQLEDPLGREAGLGQEAVELLELAAVLVEHEGVVGRLLLRLVLQPERPPAEVEVVVVPRQLPEQGHGREGRRSLGASPSIPQARWSGPVTRPGRCGNRATNPRCTLFPHTFRGGGRE